MSVVVVVDVVVLVLDVVVLLDGVVVGVVVVLVDVADTIVVDGSSALASGAVDADGEVQPVIARTATIPYAHDRRVIAPVCLRSGTKCCREVVSKRRGGSGARAHHRGPAGSLPARVDTVHERTRLVGRGTIRRGT